MFAPTLVAGPEGSGDSAPSVTLTDPSDGATVSDTVSVAADASDENGGDQVEFFVDGGSIGIDSDDSDGWSPSWDTSTSGDGDHTIEAEATDSTGQTASDSILVTVATSAMHVGDLDSASVNHGSTWTPRLIVTVHDGSHNPIAEATLSGTWSDGASGLAHAPAPPARTGPVRSSTTNSSTKAPPA